MEHIRNHDQEYWQHCARSMQKQFGGTIVVRIKQRSDPALYPAGMWFDELIGTITDVVGVDLDRLPPMFVLADGSYIPSDCAEIIDIV